MKQLGEYFSRLIQQTALQVTGFLGFLISAAFDVFWPEVNAVFAYAATILIALIIGGYTLYREMRKEIKDINLKVANLSEELETYHQKQPKLNVGFQYEGQFKKELRFHLAPLPKKPDYDTLVIERRKELLAKKRKTYSGDISSVLAGLTSINPHYEEEVENYLVEYRNYLATKYLHSLIDDRARWVYPMISNVGNAPANNIFLEFEMPSAFHQLSEKQLQDIEFAKIVKDEGEDEEVLPPSEPELYKHGFRFFEPMSLLPDINTPEVNYQRDIDGPSYEKRDGKTFITYSCKNLIQNRSENNFEPFLLWVGNVFESTIWVIPVQVFVAEIAKTQGIELNIELLVEVG